MAPRPLGPYLRRVLVNMLVFCWFLDVCCFIEEHWYMVYIIYNTIYIYYIFISLTHTESNFADGYSGLCTIHIIRISSLEPEVTDCWCPTRKPNAWGVGKIRKKCSSQRGFVLRKNAGGRRICVYVLTSSFYQFHLWYSFIALVIHSHYYIILKWNKQPVGMPPGDQKDTCKLSIVMVTWHFRGQGCAAGKVWR